MPRSRLLHRYRCLWKPGGFPGGETAPNMETPLGAPAEPRGRFRVGWRGGSQLLQSHYDIDEIVTSQAEISGESSQNCQIGLQAPMVPEVLEVPAGRPTSSTSRRVVHSSVHSSVHRCDIEAVDNRRRTIRPDRTDQPEGHP